MTPVLVVLIGYVILIILICNVVLLLKLIGDDDDNDIFLIGFMAEALLTILAAFLIGGLLLRLNLLG